MSLIQKVLGTDSFETMVVKVNAVIDTLGSFNSHLNNIWRQVQDDHISLATARKNITDIQADIVDVTETEMTAYVTSLYS
jgi:hypothetical protein